jgi:beta-glucosidase
MRVFWKWPVLSFIAFCVIIACSGELKKEQGSRSIIDEKVDSVLSLMTLDEKIGQLNQLSGYGELTGPVTEQHQYIEAIKTGMVGSMLNINGVEYTRRLQEINLTESRLGIPLLFCYDVIHGYKTIFPVPIAQACSWDIDAIEKSARVSALEAASAGQNLGFSPMLDIARDPRWGRIVEGPGEDPYLASEIARASVKGFQGDNLSESSTIAACAKHFVGYGAVEGGRDYNSSDISWRTLYETYLPPFKVAVDNNVASIMVAFSDLNGIPPSANEKIKHILRDEWKFQGVIISDWNSIGELISHGIARDNRDAALLALKAGVDIDMQSNSYSSQLANLIKDGIVSEKDINEAVKRILKLKFKLGLFENPYKYCDIQREKKLLLCEQHHWTARDMARKSIILLKNNNKILPLNTNLHSIAIIGPMADNHKDILGPWHGRGDTSDAVTLLDGIKNRDLLKTKLYYIRGCEVDGISKNAFNEAVKIARKSDVVIMAMGESADMSGEARSRSVLGLPGVQEELLKEIKKTGKPIILVLMNGRPLAIPWEKENIDCIIETWFAGTEAGNAIADVIFGDYNPSGKLAVSFPYSTGQIPVYYNHKNTGRPAAEDKYFSSKYFDAPIECLYPFGYGLSYTKFEYSNLKLSKSRMKINDTIEITVDVKNSDQYNGEETVQLYIQDLFASVTRPVKELKAFQKIYLLTGEQKTITFKLTLANLAFYDLNLNFNAEPGDFKIMIGTNSSEYLESILTLEE